MLLGEAEQRTQAVSTNSDSGEPAPSMDLEGTFLQNRRLWSRGWERGGVEGRQLSIKTLSYFCPSLLGGP